MAFVKSKISRACVHVYDILKSIMTNTDAYKGSMFPQYPKGTEYVYSYIESRGGKYDATLFFGLQSFIKQYLLLPITQDQLEFAADVWEAAGMPSTVAGGSTSLTSTTGIFQLRSALSWKAHWCQQKM